MNQRMVALAAFKNRYRPAEPNSYDLPSRDFGAYVFNRSVMQKMLPEEIYNNIVQATRGKQHLRPEYADTIAVAMKEWATNLGATHYSHWFQPLTGAAAEKHDAFIEWNSADKVIEKFTGKQLIQGEPDASSFPSGGLRTTFEARGYTGWDPSSPAFIWKAGHGTTLCIPSVYFSWTGAVLDSKIPFLRSIERLNETILPLLEMVGIAADRITCSIGLEQEYFVIDRNFYEARPDLVLSGRTLFGAPSPKGQQLQDHYFGTVKDRILSFMHHFESEALKLAIPVKTRHNEVAPSQHEVACVVEMGSQALDHNIQLMELMRKIAKEHDLAVLLHEKPFDQLNGSGKHCNWSLTTDTGINLFDPTDTPENNLHFLVLLAGILEALHIHSALLRAAIGSASNDCRLGGHEAPPAIISAFLGEELEKLCQGLASTGTVSASTICQKYDLGLSVIPSLRRDNTDRNRTSPFAFTGNKFEFRAVGSSQHPAIAATVLNAILAKSMEAIVKEIQENYQRKKGKPSRDQLVRACLPVIQKRIKASNDIRFHGDNYSPEWEKEAKKRGLPNFTCSVDAFASITSKTTIEAFDAILTPQELESRYAIALETYSHHINIEANLMLEMFKTQVLPAAMKQNELFAKTASQKGFVKLSKIAKEYVKIVEQAIVFSQELEELQKKAQNEGDLVKMAKFYCDKVRPKGEQLREVVDKIETFTDDELWPLVKYRELLFLV